MDERQYFLESNTTRPATLHCPYCRTTSSYELRYLLRKKRDRLPPGAAERDRAKFAKSQSYLVLLDDKMRCANPRCRKTFEISGIKTMSFLSE
jgi:hypothetical protein